MKLAHDPATDTLALSFGDRGADGCIELGPGVTVRLDARGDVAAIEVEGASGRLDLDGLKAVAAERERAIGRDATLAALREHMPVLAERFGVAALSLYGSTARDEATPRSDVDMVVRFDGTADAERLFGAQFYLEKVLKRPVDLATEAEIRPEFRPSVESDAIHV